MISTGINDFKSWTFQEQIDIRNQYLSGECLEMIGRDCHRHAKNVCLELIRQGVLDKKDNISKGHIRFEQYESYLDSIERSRDSESDNKHDGSDNKDSSSDDENRDEDYIYESESESESEYTESNSDETIELIVKNDIQTQIDSIYTILGNLQKCVLSLIR